MSTTKKYSILFCILSVSLTMQASQRLNSNAQAFQPSPSLVAFAKQQADINFAKKITEFFESSTGPVSAQTPTPAPLVIPEQDGLELLGSSLYFEITPHQLNPRAARYYPRTTTPWAAALTRSLR